MDGAWKKNLCSLTLNAFVCNEYNNSDGYNYLDNDTISTMLVSNLNIYWCDNDFSCSDEHMVYENINNVICSSYSCLNGTFRNISNLFCSGYRSCQNVRFNNVENVVCSGEYSCQNTTFIDINNLVCSGEFNSCQNAIFVNTWNSGCFGGNSCQNIKIDSSTSLTCYGDSSCHNSMFSNISFFTCSGVNSCHNLNVKLSNGMKISCSAHHSCVDNVFTNFIDNATNRSEPSFIDGISIYGDNTFLNNTVISTNETYAWLNVSHIKVDYYATNSCRYNTFGDGQTFINSLYVYGYYNMLDNNMKSVSINKLECSHSYSCNNLTIAKIEQSMACNAFKTCRDINILESTPHLKINCSVGQSCYDMKLLTAEKIVCDGM